jgi:hypothetical protein
MRAPDHPHHVGVMEDVEHAFDGYLKNYVVAKASIEVNFGSILITGCKTEHPFYEMTREFEHDFQVVVQ